MSSTPPVIVELPGDWSEWVPFEDAASTAPLTPGVYVARDASTHQVVYVGMAGERRGEGVRGRLRIYASGRAAVSGLGEAAMDRALADADWLRDRLAELEAGGVLRTKEWAQLALKRATLEVCWRGTASAADARHLEAQVIRSWSGSLWNRRVPVVVALPDAPPALAQDGSDMRFGLNITEVDLKSGHVRVTADAKRLLAMPRVKTTLHITLRGEPLQCLYDPRLDGSKERSGLLRLGREPMARLLAGPCSISVARNEEGQLVLE